MSNYTDILKETLKKDILKRAFNYLVDTHRDEEYQELLGHVRADRKVETMIMAMYWSYKAYRHDNINLFSKNN